MAENIWKDGISKAFDVPILILNDPKKLLECYNYCKQEFINFCRSEFKYIPRILSES